MKILLVPSWYVTEDKPLCGIFFKEQAQALRNAGHDVRVLYPDLRFKLGGLRRGIFAPKDDARALLCRKRTLTPFSERGRLPQLTRMLEELYRHGRADFGRPDIVHLHSFRLGVPALALCEKHGLPLVYTEHFSGFANGLSPAFQYEFDKTIAGCDAAVAVSEELCGRLRAVRGDTLYIPNLIDTSFFQIEPAKAAKRAPEAFVFASVGSLIPRKGFDLLLRAFAQALPDMPGARLMVAGEGPAGPALLQLADELCISRAVQFVGAVPREKMPGFINACGCLVCASRYETFGMTLIEALACGKPLVSTRCGGPESIVNAANGLLAENGDLSSLARALTQIYRRRAAFDPQTLRADCENRFGAPAVASRLTQLYEQVLRRRKHFRPGCQ